MKNGRFLRPLIISQTKIQLKNHFNQLKMLKKSSARLVSSLKYRSTVMLQSMTEGIHHRCRNCKETSMHQT